MATVASIPQGFVWKADVVTVLADEVKASIPQGFVWKRTTSESFAATSALQSHKGSSGSLSNTFGDYLKRRFNPTRVRLEVSTAGTPVRRGSSFNPTRVRLEAVLDSASSSNLPVLQSHKGSSGSVLRVLLAGSEDASIPQGFVWKTRHGQEAVEDLRRASIPQGFVWK